jgi:hypothetical protein
VQQNLKLAPFGSVFVSGDLHNNFTLRPKKRGLAGKSKLGDNNICPLILVSLEWPRFEQRNVVTPEPEANS